MRFLILLVAVSAIVISAKARSSYNKYSFAFENCSENLSVFTKVIAYIADGANTRTDSYAFFNVVDYETRKYLEVNFVGAKNFCCEKVTPRIRDEDNNAINTVLSPMVDEFDKLVSTFIHKKPMVEKLKKSIELTGNVTRAIYSNSEELLTCLTSMPPADRTPVELALFAKLNKAYYDAKIAYGFKKEIKFLNKLNIYIYMPPLFITI